MYTAKREPLRESFSRECTQRRDDRETGIFLLNCSEYIDCILEDSQRKNDLGLHKLSTPLRPVGKATLSRNRQEPNNRLESSSEERIGETVEKF